MKRTRETIPLADSFRASLNTHSISTEFADPDPDLSPEI